MRHTNFFRLTFVMVLLIGLIPVTLVQAQDCEPIVVAIWSSPEHENLIATSQVYMDATGCEVIIEEIAREAYYDKLTTTLLAGGTDYDVMYTMTDWIPEWVGAETLQPLDELFNDEAIVGEIFSLENISPTIDTLSVDGVPYGFPSEGDTAWMFYRKDLLAEAGLDVPQTWDEFLAAAQAMHTDEVYGAVIGAKPDEAVWDFMHYLFAFGGGILDEDNNVIVNSEEAVAALTFYAGLATEHALVPPDVVTYGYNEILTTLQEGKAALGVEWMAATQSLQDCEQSPKVCIDGEPQLDYALIPGIALEDGTIQRGQGASQWGWSIPASSENKADAYKFIEWLTSVEGAVIWALNGGIPSNNVALAAPEVVAIIPQFALLAEAMPYRNLFPANPVTPIMVNAFNDAVNSTVAGVIEPQAALDEAAAIMEEALIDAGLLSE
ncbi:ABC transporter substrate-binding protein [Chloroflexota bacterium]